MIEYILWLVGGVAFAALCRAAYRFGANVDEKAILGRNPFIVSPDQSEPTPSRVTNRNGYRVTYRPGEVMYATTAFAHTFCTSTAVREDLTSPIVIVQNTK